MTKTKKLFLSIFIAFLLVVSVSLASCKKDDSKKNGSDNTENTVLVKNEYDLYKESHEGAKSPQNVNITIDGSSLSSETLSGYSLIDTSKLEDLNEFKKLISCFIELDAKYADDNGYQYLYENIFDKQVTVTLNDSQKNQLDTVVSSYKERIKELLNNRKDQGQNILISESIGEITWNINVEEAGFYNLKLRYFTINGYSSSVERRLKINGSIPFEGAESFSFSRIWKDSPTSFALDGNFKVDSNGNDLKPQQIENYSFRESYFKDDMGYVTEPYMFYLEAGENTISLSSIKEPVIIDQISVVSVEKIKTYNEYLEELNAKYPNTNITNQHVHLQAEKTFTKSSPTLYPITDRSSSNTEPFSLKETKKNIVGGDQWKVLGDWISWSFTVPASGYYNISMRARQNLIRGMFSSRIAYLSVDGGQDEVLFDELNSVKFEFSSDWQNVTLGNNDGAYQFYFEEGKTYILTLEVTLGDYASYIERIQSTIDELSKTYRTIVAYTTTSPDKNRDYDLINKFPNLVADLTNYYNELSSISNSIASISGGKSDKTGVIDAMTQQLETFIAKPRTITQKLSSFSNNISSLGTLLTQLRELPLAIDYLEIHTPDYKLPKANEGFFKKVWNGICSFFLSFFIDYSTISDSLPGSDIPQVADENADSIEVWMTLGRDQANVIRNLIDTDFTKNTGIKVNLKLTGADVLLKATLAGIGPDVALNVDSTLPVNYALRNAVYDLTNFDDFWDSVYAIPDGSYSETNRTPWDDAYENVYHASSLRQFQFYSITNADIEKANRGDATAKAKVDAYYAVESYCAENGVTKEELFNSRDYTKAELQKNIKGIYALPEKQIFMVMFVRDDLFEENGWDKLFFTQDSETGLYNDDSNVTWDKVIDLVSKLQTQQLQFYLPVNDAGANALNPVFVSMLYQNGGRLYANDNKETGLMSDAAMRSFEYWTEFYTLYSFPKAASFVNRFRSGEMPVGIAYYETYNTLSVFAPELKGKWSFYLIPGTYDDETGKVNHTSTASGTGAVIMKQPNRVSEKEKTRKYNSSWEFLKWWTGAETQAQFGREMEGILGSAARHATANVKAFQSLAWPQADLDKLMQQWDQVHEMPQIAGSYIVGREIENAFRKVINQFYNARETLYEYCGNINDEINRKRKEFDLPTINN